LQCQFPHSRPELVRLIDHSPGLGRNTLNAIARLLSTPLSSGLLLRIVSDAVSLSPSFIGALSNPRAGMIPHLVVSPCLLFFFIFINPLEVTPCDRIGRVRCFRILSAFMPPGTILWPPRCCARPFLCVPPEAPQTMLCFFWDRIFALSSALEDVLFCGSHHGLQGSFPLSSNANSGAPRGSTSAWCSFPPRFWLFWHRLSFLRLSSFPIFFRNAGAPSFSFPLCLWFKRP